MGEGKYLLCCRLITSTWGGLILAQHGSGMPFDCTRLSTAGYYDGWEQEIKTAISSLKGLSAEVGEVSDFLKYQTEMQDANACIINEINKLGTSSTDISIMQQQILEKTLALTNAQKDISLAKDRVAYIRHPEQNTSNYESWFPIDRPILPISLIILIAITIFMGVFYIFLLMSALNFNFVLYMSPANTVSPWFMWLRQQLTASFWVALIILIAVVIYFVKRN
jgi:hypothetical protein